MVWKKYALEMEFTGITRKRAAELAMPVLSFVTAPPVSSRPRIFSTVSKSFSYNSGVHIFI